MKKTAAILLILTMLAILLPQAVAQVEGDQTLTAAPGSGDDGKIINRLAGWTRGGVVVAGSFEGQEFLSPGEVFSWKVTLEGIARHGVASMHSISYAYLYVPTFQYDAGSWIVDITDPTMTTTNLATGTSTLYDNDGDYELFRFNVQALLNGLDSDVDGGYSITVENTCAHSFYVYGAALIVIFHDDDMPKTYLWLNDGCEHIYSNTATTTFPSAAQPADLGPGSAYTSLSTVVGGGQADRNDEFYFDGHLVATNAFDSSNGYLFDVDQFWITPYMGTGAHDASFNDVNDGYMIYATVLVYVPIQLAAYPAPFVEYGYGYPTFIVGGTHPHGPYNWQAWTVDVLGSIGVSGRLGHEATQEFYPWLFIDDDVADYHPGTGDVTIDWGMIPTRNVISVGGPPVNIFALYFNTWAPFYMTGLPGAPHIHSALTGLNYGFMPGPGGYDHAVIALHWHSVQNKYVLVVYGVTGRGSQAACFALQNYAFNTALWHGRVVIIRWEDTNGNNLVGPGDDIMLEEAWP